MKDTYMASKYRKIIINDTMFVYVRVGIIENATIDFNHEFNLLTYTDEKNNKRKLKCLSNEYVLASDDRFVYDYPVKIDDYKKFHPNLKRKELVDIYSKQSSQIINIAYYDSEYERFRILVTNEQKLKEIEDDVLFQNFSIYYDSLDELETNIPLTDLIKMKNLLKKQKYQLLEDKLSNLIESVNGDLECWNAEEEFFALDASKKKETTEEIKEPINELNNLIGLDEIKNEVNNLIMFLDYMNKVKEKASIPRPNLHMFFSGNPGTGKTTVARIISKALYNIGYTSNNSFAEITPKDLVAGYVGQTATKTANFIKDNQGGVIFIDEAYVLASSGNKFANEALVEILKELEKNETVFIFAGYKNEMDQFMELNPGLASRIGYYLEYKDYSKEQLYQIFETKINSMGLKIDENLKDRILSHLEESKNNEHFGNGRYVDKLIQKILIKHAANTNGETDFNTLLTLTLHDFTDEIEKSLIYKKNTTKIGF